MKLLKIVTNNTINKEVVTFELGDLAAAGKLYFTRGARLQRLIEATFMVTKFYEPIDVSIDFVLLGENYNIKRTATEEGISTVLRRYGDKTTIVARDDKAIAYLEKKIGGPLKDVICDCYAGASQFRRFMNKGDLKVFGQIQKLYDISAMVQGAYEETRAKSVAAKQRAKQLMGEVTAVTKEQVEVAAAKVAEKQKTLIVLQQQQAQLKGRITDPVLKKARTELAQTRTRFEELVASRQLIETKRRQISEYDSIELIVPQLQQFEEMQREVRTAQEQRFNLIKEIDWYNEELQSVQSQIDAKQKQLENAAATRAKIEIVKEQMERINLLTGENQELADSLLRLQQQADKLQSSKLERKNELSNVEASISDLKQELESMSMPERPMSEVVESLKISVKIDEIEAQIERIRAEIAIKEGAIAERERALTVANKQLKNIMALDAVVAPLRAREVITQVIDTKVKKAQTVSSSLNQKARNLSRTLEEYSAAVIQLEMSYDTLKAQLVNARYAKAEEFKRNVIVNSQKMLNDPTAAYAINTTAEDNETDFLQQEIDAREREITQSKAEIARIQGQLTEIKRHVDINAAEIASLEAQKENIRKRYEQIVSENNGEGMHNYLRALEADNGTRYLMDMQQETVRGETQVQEVRLAVESLRTRLGELENRRKNLSSTQEALSGEGALDILVGANEQAKNEIADALLRLNALYEKHKAVKERIDELDVKIFQIQEVVLETTKTVKMNEKEIELARSNAEEVAGGDVEAMLANAEYIRTDLEAEERMLTEGKNKTEQELFTRKVEVAKLDWALSQKQEEINRVKDSLRKEFTSKDIKPEFVESVYELAKENIPQLRKTIANYDAAREQLTEKIDNLNAVVATAPSETEERQYTQLYDSLTMQISATGEEITTLSAQADKLLKQYLIYNKVRNELASAGDNISTISSLEKSLENSRIVDIIIKDKIRSFVKQASAYLVDMASNLSLGFNDNLLVYKDKEQVDIESLTINEQVLIYVALEMAVPSVTPVKGEWLILDEKLECDKTALESALRAVRDVNFVCAYTYRKPKEKLA